MAFFAHLNAAPVAFTALPETTYSGVLDSIVADLSAATASGTNNGWSLYDDQRVSGTGNFVVAYGNVGGVDVFAAQAGFAWTSNSLSSNTTNWRLDLGNQMGTECFVSRTLFSQDKVNWYTVSSIPGNSSSAWGFNADRNFAQTTNTAASVPFYVKVQHWIVLQCSSSVKSFYVWIGRPDSSQDILRVQIFETWNSGTHSGTNGSNMEIMRGLDYVDTLVWANNWDNQPVRYMIWFLADAFAMWAAFGAGALTPGRVTRADFCYAGNLDTTGLRTGDTNALAWLCSNLQLSGFGCNNNQAFNVSNTTSNSMNGNFGGARCLRTLAGELWAMPTGSATRPGGWNNNNQYVPFARALPYMYHMDNTQLDPGGRFLMTEFDLYQVGAGSAGFLYNEGKRGMMKYVKCPVNNPSGGHLMTFGPADDGNTYILFKVYPGPAGFQSVYTTYFSADSFNEVKHSSWAYNGKTGTSGEITVGATPHSIVFKWFLMPINL